MVEDVLAERERLGMKCIECGAVWGTPHVETCRFHPRRAEDGVNHPPHYKSTNGLEAIDVVESFELGFCLGNVVKYVLRAGKKGDALVDLKKARWYLDREIARREGQARLSDPESEPGGYCSHVEDVVSQGRCVWCLVTKPHSVRFQCKLPSGHLRPLQHDMARLLCGCAYVEEDAAGMIRWKCTRPGGHEGPHNMTSIVHSHDQRAVPTEKAP